MLVKPLLCVAVVALAAPAVRAETVAPCAVPEAAETVRLAGSTAEGDPLLDDGRVLRLVGLAPAQDESETAGLRVALAALTAAPLRLVVLGAADRWGRLPARLIAAGPGAAEGGEEIAARLIRGGAAWALPEAASAGCDVRLRQAEAQARAAGIAGLPSPLDAHKPAALAGLAGRIVVLEGRVASVAERGARTYLNFSRRRGEAASVVVPRALWRTLQAAGWTASSLRGKRVRVRGILGGSDGLLLELAAREALEPAEPTAR